MKQKFRLFKIKSDESEKQFTIIAATHSFQAATYAEKNVLLLGSIKDFRIEDIGESNLIRQDEPVLIAN